MGRCTLRLVAPAGHAYGWRFGAEQTASERETARHAAADRARSPRSTPATPVARSERLAARSRWTTTASAKAARRSRWRAARGRAARAPSGRKHALGDARRADEPAPVTTASAATASVEAANASSTVPASPCRSSPSPLRGQDEGEGHQERRQGVLPGQHHRAERVAAGDRRGGEGRERGRRAHLGEDRVVEDEHVGHQRPTPSSVSAGAMITAAMMNEAVTGTARPSSSTASAREERGQEQEPPATSTMSERQLQPEPGQRDDRDDDARPPRTSPRPAARRARPPASAASTRGGAIRCAAVQERQREGENVA